MGAAATEIVGKGMLDVVVDGRIGILSQKRRGLHDHPIDAITALHGLFVDESQLQRVRLLGRAEAFEGDDLARSDTGERRHGPERACDDAVQTVAATCKPDRGAPHLLGRPVSEKRRKRRKAALHPDAQRGALAGDDPDPMCLGRRPQKKGGYRQAQIHRLRSRRGIKKAIGAVAASILTAAYHMLAHGILYQDIGPDHLDRRALHNLGYAVQITPLAA
jgi:hypothetical protein